MIGSQTYRATGNQNTIVFDQQLRVSHITPYGSELLGLEKGDHLSAVRAEWKGVLNPVVENFLDSALHDSFVGKVDVAQCTGGLGTFDVFLDTSYINGAPALLLRLVNRIWIDSSIRINRSLDVANVGLLEIDAKLNCIYANDGWGGLTGQDPQDAEGRGWLNCLTESKRMELVEWFIYKPHQALSKEITTSLHTPLGQVRYSRWILQYNVNTRGSIHGITAVVFDVTDEVSKTLEAEELARYDGLTGLLNRQYFQDQLRLMVDSSIRSQDLSLFCLDLDGFKDINDTYGHDAGDKVIREVALRMKRILRKGDIAARLGGDEFALILNNIPEFRKNSEAVALKLLEEINKPIVIDVGKVSKQLYIGVSIGITGLVNELEQCDSTVKSEQLIIDMMSHADFAMYSAKRRGKNRFRFYDRELDEKAREDFRIRSELFNAFKNDELGLKFQPIISPLNGMVVGSEALLRWNNKEFSSVGTDKFISILEKSAFCLDFGKVVVSQSFAHYRELRKAGVIDDLYYMSINLSPLQIHNSDFIHWFLSRLCEHDIKGSAIQVEITESIFAEVNGPVRKNLELLESAGIRIALDDFGTGYSSLSYLEHFPIHCVKIDRSLVQRSETRRGRAITSAVLAMCNDLEIRTIAEGIETRDQLDMMRQLGCDGIQGYLMAKPLSAAAHLRFLGQQLVEQTLDNIQLELKQVFEVAS